MKPKYYIDFYWIPASLRARHKVTYPHAVSRAGTVIACFKTLKDATTWCEAN